MYNISLFKKEIVEIRGWDNREEAWQEQRVQSIYTPRTRERLVITTQHIQMWRPWVLTGTVNRRSVEESYNAAERKECIGTSQKSSKRGSRGKENSVKK